MSRYEYPNKSYYAYNETFVDDEGLELYQNELRGSQYLHDDEDDNESINNQSYQNRQPDNLRYYQAANRYDERLDYLNLSMREPPIGEGATYRHVESTNINNPVPRDRKQPQQHQQQKQQQHHQQQQPQHRYEVIQIRRPRSSSVPSRRRIVSNEPNVLAPMIAQADRQLRRSQSTILSHTRQRQADQNRELRHQPQICSTPRTQRQTATPVRLKSYAHFMSPAESNLSHNSMSTMGPRNTAIISPNYRQDNQSALPLLSASPVKLQFTGNSPNKSNSWLNMSNQRVPSEPLWFAGLILLFTGGGSCLLCLYILSKSGRKYYLDFGAISGFVCLILGMIGCKTSRWLPHRHYVTGYILLSAFSLLQCGVLAVLASDSKELNNDIVDIAGGAICGLSALSLIMAVLGFLTSACCNLPPPDSRVSHSVQGFTV